MRTAIVHYWLLGMRGGERVVEALCDLYPQADIFTLFYDPRAISETIRKHHITASYLNPLRSCYRQLLPFMPSALESFDLRDYDLVISSESGPAKGVLTSANTKHLCYCHTPMRYLWELYPAYLNDWTPAWKRPFMRPLANRLRLWDFASAARVDDFVANSANVQQRIWKTYRRESEVIHPPVATQTFRHEPAEDYFLIVSELVAYKRLDYAVRSFAQNGRRLRIVGDGPEFANLRSLARPNIEFCGRVSDQDLRTLCARARAFLLPGEEDFGIATVEALASGKPVIALARGGALETVPHSPLGGVLYPEPTEASLQSALREFETIEPSLEPVQLQQWATRFDQSAFKQRIQEKIRRIISAPPVPSRAPYGS
jgi:glycosyltransferase involved in cell wall biosynthesis